ncbi:MAG: hypothetical protein MZU97_16625 [Bacillus subtilis]|nr:hypothetical protein [Bacillus subtilis]
MSEFGKELTRSESTPSNGHSHLARSAIVAGFSLVRGLEKQRPELHRVRGGQH